ncbi:hypothetical protein [Saccharothrix sp. HUAS TT1]|uniref:hypothetical protein n=1 Tax=unclassified Saccharothrix TaxID=2593673 RepID=UPI00345BD602
MGSPGEPGPRGDSDPNDPPDRPHVNITHATANVMSGTTIGPTIQANVINGGVHVHYGRTPVTLPHRFGEVPPRAAGFQARAVAELIGKTPNEDVEPHGRNTRMAVLFGLSGMGKTQLAAAYAEHAWSSGEIDLLVWATAGSRDLVVAE